MAFMEYRHVLQEIFKLAKPAVYVEIGVLRAGTFNLLSPLVSERACAVDMNGCRYVEKHPHVEIYPIMSDDFWPMWKDPVDICFIDANHSKEAVLRDLENAAKFIREGTGIIFMHDTYPASREWTAPDKCNDAYAAAWAIRQKFPEFEFATFPWGGAGLSVARLAPKHLHWKE
jgi:hypothetical protein